MSVESDRHTRIFELFVQAEQHPPHEREDWLRRNCDQPELVVEVLELLALGSDSQPTAFAPLSAVQTASAAGLVRALAEQGARGVRYGDPHLVARGGMGAILRVWDTALQRPLAMKVIRGGESGSNDPSSAGLPLRVVDRFVREARVTGQLDHPGIVPVHELDVDENGRVYFTMKLVEGRTLDEVFEEFGSGAGDWSEQRVIGVLLRACEALEFAHSRGVVHRDLKPANLMVGRFGEVLVMDWGLARVLADEDHQHLSVRVADDAGLHAHDAAGPLADAMDAERPLRTMDGDILGTPSYMPPEQADGRVEDMGPHSDVYSFGAILYHMLSGHAPYLDPGADARGRQVLARLRAGPPAALTVAAPSASPELVSICERAMSRDPRARYRDMGELARDLRDYAEGRVVRAHEAGAWAEARKWVRRNRSLAAASLSALLLALGGSLSVAIVQSRGRAASERERERALAAQARAERSEELARLETLKVLRLSDMKRLQELEALAHALWPAHPGRIDGMLAWIDQAEDLLARLPLHRDTLQSLRAEALPYSSSDAALDRESRPSSDALAAARAELQQRIQRVEAAGSEEERSLAEARVDELDARILELEASAAERHTWRFASTELQWQHDVLRDLIDDMLRFEAQLMAEDAATPEFGWSLPRRLQHARRLRSGFAPAGEYAAVWQAALPGLAAAYPGLELTPQMDLLPLGEDPQSGLWEFAVLSTGIPPERDEFGQLVLAAESAVVLVLLPGGSAWLGAQSTSPTGRHYDPQAQWDEAPVHEVQLSPFFLAKFELTQGCWARQTGQNPAQYSRTPDGARDLLPVERVTWEECDVWLRRVGLGLPTEARWEYAARAGTETPWWTGTQRDSLPEANAANLADQALARSGVLWKAIADWPELDDGFAGTAPVGSFSANPFGLHEVHGNVWEWCLDGYDPRGYAKRAPKDPLHPWHGIENRVNRGGGHDGMASGARSANRSEYPATNSNPTTGVRPAREILP
jgi:formylglycine-generating enzyme required for sulfatase activity/tRNA A-37 threonylcarbamoyl transferase component Bud32